MSKIFITHCSNKKEPSLKGTNVLVTPDKLYKSSFLLGFIDQCKLQNVKWAIFSDKYGIVLPNDKIAWYNKPPNTVTKDERDKLLADLLKKLGSFSEIYFYHNPGRFCSLYKRIIEEAKEKGMNIILFSHKYEIS